MSKPEAIEPGSSRNAGAAGSEAPQTDAQNETGTATASVTAIAPKGGATSMQDAPGTRKNRRKAGGKPKRKRGGAVRGGKKAKLRDVSPPKPGTAPPIQIVPPATAARRKPRHYGVLLSFILLVLAPLGVAGWYLYERAADQYASYMGFTVRQEDSANAAELVGGIVGLGTAGGSDTDILNEFIQSQGLVKRIDDRLDLRTLYSKPDNDPIFTIAPDASIEELMRYWRRMVTIYYDGGSGLIETRVLAFAPEDAQAITRAIYEESSETINRLSAIAQEDSTRYARDELALAEERLRQSRSALTEFRARTQIVDPNIDIQGQMGLLSNLQGQLAAALIEMDLLTDNTRDNDPRLRQAQQRIAVIEARIAEERQKFGIGENSASDTAYASLVGTYESLVVDREFAEQSYLAARANLDVAQAEAQRQTRYLAAYAQPTLAESSEYPQRIVLLGILALFAFAAWSVGILIYYSIRDRR